MGSLSSIVWSLDLRGMGIAEVDGGEPLLVAPAAAGATAAEIMSVIDAPIDVRLQPKEPGRAQSVPLPPKSAGRWPAGPRRATTPGAGRAGSRPAAAGVCSLRRT